MRSKNASDNCIDIAPPRSKYSTLARSTISGASPPAPDKTCLCVVRRLHIRQPAITQRQLPSSTPSLHWLNAQPQLGTKKHQYGAASQLAEWPVFYSYAEQEGPIIVASQKAGVSTMYVATAASKDPVYLYHNKNHFQRLISCSPHV